MRSLIVGFLLVFGLLGQAQILEPVKWESELVKVEEGSYELRLTAVIEKNWVIYSQHLDDNGPIPTSFEITTDKSFKLDGGVIEPSNPIVEHDDMFDMTLTKFKGPATFVQKISAKKLESISGSIEFMTCDSKRCLPPSFVDFKAILQE